ncbi:MAG: hypothetical protein HY001_04595 [Candidatus Portnoybacteria bacterium]|nr:hypothetical protein [Candidatus Portnoybacteria bacterium]
MVKIIQKDDKKLYQCEECGFLYENKNLAFGENLSGFTSKEWAEKCEAWCSKNKSCNVEIISHGKPS